MNKYIKIICVFFIFISGTAYSEDKNVIDWHQVGICFQLSTQANDKNALSFWFVTQYYKLHPVNTFGIGTASGYVSAQFDAMDSQFFIDSLSTDEKYKDLESLSDDVVKLLKKNRAKKYYLESHCDEVNHNLALYLLDL